MIRAEPAGGRRLALIERTIELVRIGAALGACLLFIIGGDDARSYPSAALTAVSLAAVYTVAMATPQFRLSPEISTALDLTFTVGIIATTGAGRSVAIGLLFVVVGAAALRFSPRASLWIAIAGSSCTGAVILLVPRPDLPTSLRAELAVGWGAGLVLTAVLVARLSNFELEEREELLVERERAASLAEQSAARRRTLRMVAHDLTAPLAAVDGIARTLNERSSELDDHERREALGLLVEHAADLRGFATSLRDVANVGDITKLQRSDAAKVDLHEFLDGVCRLQTFGPDRNIEFVPSGASPTIATDPDKLRRVLVNLMDNAVRHSPANGSVSVWCSTGASNSSITVVDSGSGVDESQLDQIFLPEWQGAGTVGDSGLGLWIVSELVGDLGGTVAARNIDQRGLAVEVHLPLERPD